MKYCPKCGRKTRNNALFCPNCGYKFYFLTSKSPLNIHQNNPTRNKNDNHIIIIFVIIAMVLSLGLFVHHRNYVNYIHHVHYIHPINRIPPNLANRNFTFQGDSGLDFGVHTLYFSNGENGENNAEYKINSVTYHSSHSNNNVIIHAERTAGDGPNYNTFYLHVSHNNIKRYSSTSDLS